MEGKKKGGCGSFLFTLILAVLAYGLISALFSPSKGTASKTKATARTTTKTAAKATVRTTQRATFVPVTRQPIPTPGPTQPDPIYIRTDRNWSALMDLPSRTQIDACNRTSTERSPYVGGWLTTSGKKFWAYSAEIKADFLPDGTYCCPANFDLEYSYLKKHYRNVHTEYNGVAGYAGLQRQPDGSTNAILSFWDVFYTDGSGRQQTLRARLAYPTSNGNDSFSGEGTGAHYLAPYNWVAGRWYEMLIQCGSDQTTGNTVMEQWVRDLGTGNYTLLCKYDMGVPDVYFKGDVAVFLENYEPKTSGEVRTMEIRNVKIYTADGRWVGLNRGQFSQGYGYPGSYRYSADGDTFCMITTGVKNRAGTPQKSTWLTVR